MTFSFDEKQRNEWAGAVAAAMVLSAQSVRARMADRLDGPSIPADSRVFQTDWWEQELDGTAQPVFHDVAAQAGSAFVDGTGLTVDDTNHREMLADVVAGTLAALYLRGEIVSDRVSTLVAEAADKGWESDRLAQELGLNDDNDSGPLSDALMGGYGVGVATSIAEGAAARTAELAGVVGTKVWRCAFANSRPEHEDADGQTVGVDEEFDIGGFPAGFPGDDQLPIELVVNCQCWLEYDVEAVANEEESPLALAASPTLRAQPFTHEETAVAKPTRDRKWGQIRRNTPTWVTQAARAFQNDGIVITVEPLPAQKTALAVEGGETPADLHVTLLYLDLDPADTAARQAVTGVLAKASAVTAPIEGEVSGLGWFGDPTSMTLALIDAPGLANLRAQIHQGLADAGYPADDTHDFEPHTLLANSQVDAAAKVGMPLTFNELRLRWQGEILAYDLVGIEQPPEPAQPEPSQQPPAPGAPTPEEAPVAQPTTTAATLEVAPPPPMPDMPPAPEVPPADASSLNADGLLDELARRIIDQVGGDPAETADVEEDIEELIGTLIDELEEESAEPGDTPDPAPAPVSTDMPVAATRGDQLRARVLAIAAQQRARKAMATDTLPDVSGMNADGLLDELARRIIDQAGAGADEQADTEEDIEELIAFLVDELQEEIAEPAETPASPDAAAPATTPAPTPAPMPAASVRQRLALALQRRRALAAAEPDGVADAGPTYDWEAVLTMEGTLTGDGRLIAEGALTWRDLPLPFMLQTVNAPGHDGSEFCGWIHEIERVGSAIVGRGSFVGEAGDRIKAILDDPNGAGRYGVSVDIDMAQVVYTDASGEELTDDEAIDAAMFGGVDVVECLVVGRIMGVTATPFPAIMEAQVYPLDSDDSALVAGASGGVWRTAMPTRFALDGTPTQALVASASGMADHPAPPAELFGLKPMEDAVPFTVGAPLADGTVPCYGLVAKWGTCHIGDGSRCIPVPKSNDFRSFYTGKTVLTREGQVLPVGPVILDTVHPNLLMQASDAQAFYAHTGCAIADVRLYTNEHGIVAAGVLRPDADPLTVRRLRASDISPDWRPINGEHKIVALLAVNASGFLVEGIAASAGRFRPYALIDSNTGQMGALVAAGAIHRPQRQNLSVVLDGMRAEIQELRNRVEELSARPVSLPSVRAARMEAALARMGLKPVECSDCA